ncbi:SDR family oxidoreductase [Phaeovulum sp. W22_SRMD_FR3]|uniref:SDR family oxidoreductase n=1 Tax=Phaeovulum sp. W22_SRMD_FR3 TaxID=3240274 RepID=UPI003F9EAB1E
MAAILTGKTAVITGAGSGMGREIALSLAAAGARVVLCGRRAGPLDALAAEIETTGGTAITAPLDITDSAAIRALVAELDARYGGVDLLINNAGSASKVLNARWLSEAEFLSTVNVNLTAVFTFSQAVLPAMLARGAGTIITVSSLAAVNPNLLGGAAYGAAKAGVRNFMGYMHNTYRHLGLRSICILPGEADTPILNNRARPPLPEERARMLAPEDVAAAVMLCATLPGRATVPELHICPTFQRDISTDLEIARWQGAPADLPDLPDAFKGAAK